MRIELTGRHEEITPALRRLVDSRLNKIDRLLNDSAVSAQVVLTREKRRLHAEITLHARGEKFLHGVGTSGAWSESLAQAGDKIAQQARRVKGKWQDRKRHATAHPDGADAGDGESLPAAAPPAARASRARRPRTFTSSRQAVKAMSIEAALQEVDARTGDAVVFRDLERGSISVIYRRPNGELTLVETDA
jgi:ribosomal subunit interface protein